MTKVLDDQRSHTIHSIEGTLGKPPMGSLPRAYFPETDPNPVNGVARTSLSTTTTTHSIWRTYHEHRLQPPGA